MVLLPVYLLLFFNLTSMLPIGALLESILLMIAVPFALATEFLMFRAGMETLLRERVLSLFESAQVVFLEFAIMTMFASEGRVLMDNLEIVYLMLIP